MSKDIVFKLGHWESGSFSFNEDVTAVFDDMIHRSVPLYSVIQSSVVELSRRFAQPNTSIVDLGCSLGTTLSVLAEGDLDPSISFLGVDFSPSMLEKAALNCPKATFFCADLNEPVNLPQASVVILVLSLQFVSSEKRQALVQMIYDALIPGGCCILVEKMAQDSEPMTLLFEDLYYHFKFNQGYTMDEILNKKRALEGVLIPWTRSAYVDAFKTAGFSAADSFFKWMMFEGMVMIK